MSLDVGTLQATLKLDAGQFESALDSVGGKAGKAGKDAEKSFKGAGDAAKDAGKSTAGLSSGLAGVGGAAAGSASKVKMAGAALAGLAAGGAVVAFFQDSISAASDLNETMNKSNTIFGDSASSVDKWGDTAAKSLGLSKSQAIEAAAGFGNMFTQLGFTSQAAAGLSMNVVQMSADLGSFNNLPTADVADKISSAFMGEYDSLQALIPTINAAAVEQEAMAATGKTSAATLTAQEKATAVLAIVQRDGAKAMGDFAKTSDGLANSQKIVTAQMEDAKARIGQGLLPVWQKLVTLFGEVGVPAIEALGTALGGLLGFLNDIPGPVVAAVLAFGGMLVVAQVAGWIGGLTAASLAAAGGLASMGGAAMIASVALNALGGPWVVAMSLGAAAIAFFASNTEDAVAATVDLTGAVDKNTGAFTANAAAIISQQTSDAAAKYVELGGAVGDFTAALMGAPGAQERVNKTLLDASIAAAKAAGASDEYLAALQAGGIGAQSFIDTTKEGAASVTGFAGATGTAAEVSGVLNSGLAQLNETQAAAKTAAAEAGGAIEKQGGAAKTAVDPVTALQDATKALGSAASLADAAVQFLTAALDAASGGSISAEQAMRLQEAAIRDIGASTRDVAGAMADQQTAAEAVGKAVDEFGASSTEAAAAQRDYEDAEKAVSDATDAQAEANIKARDSALQYTSQVYANAAAHGNLKGAAAAATGALTKAKGEFIAAQPAADRASGAAQKLADKLFGIPKNTVAKIAETGAAATAAKAGEVKGAVEQIPANKLTELRALDNSSGTISGVQSRLDSLTTYKQIVIETVTRGALAAVATGGKIGDVLTAAGYSAGGKLPGQRPADAGRDNLLGTGPGGVPIGLQSSEWVIRSSAARFYGDERMAAINAGTYPKLAAGGSVGSAGAGSGGPQVDVTVWLGGEQLDPHIDTRVDGKLVELVSGLGRGRAQVR